MLNEAAQPLDASINVIHWLLGQSIEDLLSICIKYLSLVIFPSYVPPYLEAIGLVIQPILNVALDQLVSKLNAGVSPNSCSVAGWYLEILVGRSKAVETLAVAATPKIAIEIILFFNFILLLYLNIYNIYKYMKIYKKNFLPLVLISTSAIIPTITSLTTTSHGSKKLGTKLNSDKDDIKQEVGN
jgi:hypothetical protein